MDRLYLISDEEFEKLFLDRWSSTKKNNNESHNISMKKDHTLQVHRGFQMEIHKESHKDSMKMDKANTASLSSYGHSILQVHGFLHQENAIVFINPSCKYNFISVNLVKRLQVPTNHIQST